MFRLHTGWCECLQLVALNDTDKLEKAARCFRFLRSDNQKPALPAADDTFGIGAHIIGADSDSEVEASVTFRTREDVAALRAVAVKRTAANKRRRRKASDGESSQIHCLYYLHGILLIVHTEDRETTDEEAPGGEDEDVIDEVLEDVLRSSHDVCASCQQPFGLSEARLGCLGIGGKGPGTSCSNQMHQLSTCKVGRGYVIVMCVPCSNAGAILPTAPEKPTQALASCGPFVIPNLGLTCFAGCLVEVRESSAVVLVARVIVVIVTVTGQALVAVPAVVHAIDEVYIAWDDSEDDTSASTLALGAFIDLFQLAHQYCQTWESSEPEQRSLVMADHVTSAKAKMADFLRLLSDVRQWSLTAGGGTSEMHDVHEFWKERVFPLFAEHSDLRRLFEVCSRLMISCFTAARG